MPRLLQVMDRNGGHALCCTSLGIYTRHNALRNEVAAICTEMGLQAEIEVRLPGTYDRPADVLIHGLGECASTAVDFSVVHPLQLSANLAEVQAGKLAKRVEQRKIHQQAGACRSAGWEFSPFVIETLGAWGGHAQHLVQQIIRRWALKKKCAIGEAARLCKSRIAASVFRGVCRQLERGFPEDTGVAEGPGRGLFEI